MLKLETLKEIGDCLLRLERALASTPVTADLLRKCSDLLIKISDENNEEIARELGREAIRAKQMPKSMEDIKITEERIEAIVAKWKEALQELREFEDKVKH